MKEAKSIKRGGSIHTSRLFSCLKQNVGMLESEQPTAALHEEGQELNGVVVAIVAVVVDVEERMEFANASRERKYHSLKRVFLSCFFSTIPS